MFYYKIISIKSLWYIFQNHFDRTSFFREIVINISDLNDKQYVLIKLGKNVIGMN